MGSPLLVFDLDGTLVDTAPDLLATLGAVLPRHGVPVGADDPELRNGIGLGARHLIEFALRRAALTFGEADVAAMLRDFLAHYEANICAGSKLYPGLADLLDRFEGAGWSFAVCTNKPEGLSRLLLQTLGIAHRFAAICGGDSFAARKPDAAHLLNTISAAAADLEATVMVGDSRTDLETARNANVLFVGVSFGYSPVPMADLGPDVLIDGLDDLIPDALCGLLRNTPLQSAAALSAY